MVPLAYFKISYSLFRYLLSIIVFTLMLSTNGCLYFEYSTGGNIEEENIDYSAIAKEAMQKANEMSLKLEQGSEILHRDHPLVKEAKISIESIVQLYKSQKKPSYDLHDEYSLRYSTFEFMDEPEIQVIVLADDEPLAQILPNGKLYITSGLIDHDSPYGAGFPLFYAGLSYQLSSYYQQDNFKFSLHKTFYPNAINHKGGILKKDKISSWSIKITYKIKGE